jgi:hypothetical protein
MAAALGDLAQVRKHLDADPNVFRVIAQFKPLTADGPAWASPVIHNRRLYLPQNDLLACYDLSAQP